MGSTRGTWVGRAAAADEVSNGRVLYMSLADRPQFPLSMIPLIEWVSALGFARCLSGRC